MSAPLEYRNPTSLPEGKLGRRSALAAVAEGVVMERPSQSSCDAVAPDEFERLLHDHARVMASAIRRVCGRRHEALVADVQQEVHLALWKRLQGVSLEAIQHPTSYLYKVALTTALAQVRRLDREEPTDLEEVEGYVRSHEPFERLEPPERTRLLQQVLEQLDEDPRRAMRAYLAGFNHIEIAELFGWSASRARHLVYRSLDRLREAGRGAATDAYTSAQAEEISS